MLRQPARQIAEDLWLLDTLYQDEPGVVASYLLTGAAGAALVDVGSAATLEHLLAAIRATGVEPQDIRHIVLTHIHLDHAGAAGALLAYCPVAQVYVHERGAPHLSDPSRLIASAARIYGDQMQRLWGTITPVPSARLAILADGAELVVGERRLQALYTPGHAVHHLAFRDAVHGAIFAGDVAGVRLEGVNLVRPPTPPPDLSLEDWYTSLDRLSTLDPRTLYLAHYGPVTDVTRHIAQLRRRLGDWGDIMLQGMREGLDEEALTRALTDRSSADLARAAGAAEAEVRRRYELAANYRMSAQGYMRYYQTRHPELLAPTAGS